MSRIRELIRNSPPARSARRRKCHCSEKFCEGRIARHRRCVDCQKITCGRQLRVIPWSLKRSYVPACWDCMTEYVHSEMRSVNRYNRTSHDWTRPIPNQYPGFTRDKIKEFLDSGKQEMCVGRVTKVQPSALNTSIAVLGLDEECYAEQRAKHVYLRRIA